MLVYISAWAEMRQFIGMGDSWAMRFVTMGNNVFQLKEMLDTFAKKNGHYPDALAELPGIGGPDASIFFDAWNHRFDYRKTDHGYRLVSLGRDGAPGGVGLDADIDFTDFDPNTQGFPCATPTLSQFLFDAVGSAALFKVAFFASICAGLAAYLASGPREGQAVAWQNLAKTFVVSAVGAVLVSLFLLTIYLMGEHH